VKSVWKRWKFQQTKLYYPRMKNKRLSESVPDSRNMLHHGHVVTVACISGVTSDCILSVLIHTKMVQVTALTAKIIFFLSVSEI